VAYALVGPYLGPRAVTAPELTLTSAEVNRLTRRGLRLAQFTVVYNLTSGENGGPCGWSR
jgi:hypothetical protein